MPQQQGLKPRGLLRCINLRSGESAPGQNPSANLLPQRRLSLAADKGYLAAMPEMGQQETPALQKTNTGETQ
jgi:hypothetical protein